MGIAERLKEYQAQRFVFRFPDGEELILRPVRAIEIIPRLGVAPDAVGRFLTAGEASAETLDPADVPQAALLAGRLEEAYYVYGVVSVAICFDHEALEGKCPDGSVPVSVFRAWVRDQYGEEILAALERRLREVSGEIRPDEVAQDRESFREVAPGPALHGEDVRDEPDRVPPHANRQA